MFDISKLFCYDGIEGYALDYRAAPGALDLSSINPPPFGRRPRAGVLREKMKGVQIMTLKDVLTLATKGTSLEQMKQISGHENADELIQLVKAGMKFPDALEAVKLVDDKPNESPEKAAGDDAEEQSINWEEKYNALVEKTQRDKARENNKTKTDDEEAADRKKHLEDTIRSFM